MGMDLVKKSWQEKLVLYGWVFSVEEVIQEECRPPECA
jgi:hypothetical protein